MRAEWAAALGCLVVAAFEVALALGAPWGRAAWGGAHGGELPAGLRVASALASVVWVGGTLLVVARGRGRGGRVVRVVTWGLGGLLLVGAVMNFASSSPYERYGWGPLALLLGGLTIRVARGGETRPG